MRRGREPVARIMPLPKQSGIRGFGSMKGEIWIASDAEMKKVDREIEQMFHESVVFPEEKPQSTKD